MRKNVEEERGPFGEGIGARKGVEFFEKARDDFEEISGASFERL